MSTFKRIMIGVIAAVIAAVIFFTLLINAVAMAIQSILDISKSTDFTEAVACEITGAVNGNDLELKLTYDSFTVKGITGTISASGQTFSASTKNSSTNQRTQLSLPTSGADLDVQTFMAYTAVTAKNSSQYKLLNGANAKDSGIYRKIGSYYAIALGSYYGSTIGTKYILTFKQADGSTKTIKAILGDQKSDAHTDSNHQYHKTDKSVVEFITAKGTADNVSATQKKINNDFGVLTGIYRLGGTEVKLKGTISGNNVSVTGTVDGTTLVATGTITGNKFEASGFIGDGENYLVEGGLYSGGKFTWPVPGNTRVSSDYGWRICPYHGKEFHSGIDIPANTGTTIVAAASGKVVLSSYSGGYGNCVIISHGSGLFSLYGHNSKNLVHVGDTVKQGDAIAKVGSTGNSTGAHLHFEVRKGGNKYSNHTSPWTYLKK